MTDRRIHPRSVFLAPASAQLQLTIDGQVESWRETRAVIITSSASTCGDELLVHVMSDNEVTYRIATVLACEPIIGQPAVRYRLSLSLAPGLTPVHHDSVPSA